MGKLCKAVASVTVASCLTACVAPATYPLRDDGLLREGLAGTGDQRIPETAQSEAVSNTGEAGVVPAAQSTSQIVRGSSRFVSPRAAIVPAAGRRPPPANDEGVILNFNNQPIRAVVTSILGDLLQENYTIGQDVKGEVSFSTSRPVARQDALSILEMLLSWTGNALVREGNRYLVLPANQAVAGRLTPALRMAEPGNGLRARLFVLQFISATEMQKLLTPFARENAFLLVDPARNVIAMAGTPEELANYESTIETFDLNWLKGMSIGVFGLQRASVTELMPELQRLFGPESGTPLAGMLRFLPIARTNAVVAISSQPEYLSEVGRWIETIDRGGGNEAQMYVYDVRNMKASDLARYLRQIYSNEPAADEPEVQVAPGLRTTTLASGSARGGINPMGGQGGGTIGSSQGLSSLAPGGNRRFGDAERPRANGSGAGDESSEAGNAARRTAGNDLGVRITAQRSSNQLIIRARPAQWSEIQSAIRRLDNPPLQVQIETRILEVSLTGELDLGVQWYLGRLAGNSTTDRASGTATIANRPGSQAALGQGGAGVGATDALFYSFVSNNLQIALRALEASGNTRVLSAPSLVVMNNQSAQIQVGDNIPINQTSVTTTSELTLSSVQYVQTGVILDVVPRINPGGLVYLDIQQQVSDAGSTTDARGNPSISTRSVSTQVAVQSGQTVLLGGLIQQSETVNDNSIPYLSSIPGLHWLFGNTRRTRGRSELIVLITPRVIGSADQANRVTDDYRRQLQLIQPLPAARFLRPVEPALSNAPPEVAPD